MKVGVVIPARDECEHLAAAIEAVRSGGPPACIVVADCADKEAEPEPLRFVNPEIVWVSDELREHEEGCLSIPEFYEMVERPTACTISAIHPPPASAMVSGMRSPSACSITMTN